MRDEFAAAIAKGLVSRTLTSCSRWAAKRRVMGAPFPGPYAWSRHPWVKELHDTWTPESYVMKGAQLGVTEVAINRSFYTLDALKRDVMYVLPTASAASDFSKTRFSSALELSAYIGSMFTDINSVQLKRAGANSLYIRGSKSRTGLKSVPVSELILDEVDEMDIDRVLVLAKERLSGQVHKHTWGISTPTIPEHGIHKLFIDSTQEHFFFRCPGCNKHIEFTWPDSIELVGEHGSDPRCAESYLKCTACGRKLPHEEKPDFLAAGQWVASKTNPNVRGFHINQLYSFTMSPGEIVVAYLKSRNDELATKEFFNSKLGVPWVASGARITEEMVLNAIRDYSIESLRPVVGGARLITMGVDQGATNYAVVCEWIPISPDLSDLSTAYLCRVLWAGSFPGDDWTSLYHLMGEWQVLYTVVDCQPETNEARRFCRKFSGYAGMCRYERGKAPREIATSDEDSGAPLHKVDRSSWLSTSLGRFKCNPTTIELPRDLPGVFSSHIQCLVRTYERESDGSVSVVYKTTGDGMDHYAHALNYAEIALHKVPRMSEELGRIR